MATASPAKRLIQTTLVGIVTVTAAACAGAAPGSSGPVAPSFVPAAPNPVVVAAGEIACPTTHPAYNSGEGTATECRHKHTANLIADADAVLVLGNAQYPTGSMRQYQVAYESAWGQQRNVTHPTPGEHDYASGSGKDYLQYFGVPEYYSFDIGSWHWVSLNSEIPHSQDSEQFQWLQQDLAGTSQPCIGAYWSSPAFSSSPEGADDAEFRPFWEALYAARADLVLGAEARHYERFAKLRPDGTLASDGIRQFVVGTGGWNLQDFTTVEPHSESRGKVFGVLQLRLNADDYGWEFLTESGGPFSDAGTAACNP
jgi:hypothetical protein